MEVVDSDEEYLDDPITLIDYEQYRFGMTTQDFDTLNEVPSKKTRNYLSNGKRRVETFFDAYKCKPLTVQLVDCVKYQRYHKLKLKECKRSCSTIIKPPLKEIKSCSNLNSSAPLCHNASGREDLPVIKHVFSLNCNVYTTALNEKYDYKDKSGLKNLIKLGNQNSSKQKIDDAQIPYREATIVCKKGIDIQECNNVNEFELNTKHIQRNKMSHGINNDEENDCKTAKINKNGSRCSENSCPKLIDGKALFDLKELDNYLNVKKQGPFSHCGKCNYKESDIDKTVPNYKKFTLLPLNYSSGNLSSVKAEVSHSVPILPVSNIPSRNSLQENKVYIPCLYVKSRKDFSDVPLSKKNIPEPEVVLNDNCSRSNLDKGYSPPILPILTFETLLDCYSRMTTERSQRIQK